MGGMLGDGLAPLFSVDISKAALHHNIIRFWNKNIKVFILGVSSPGEEMKNVILKV